MRWCGSRRSWRSPSARATASWRRSRGSAWVSPCSRPAPSSRFECLRPGMAAVAAGDVAPVPAGVICCAAISDALLAFDLERAAAWTAVLDRWCSEQQQLIAFTGQCRALDAALLLIHGRGRKRRPLSSSPCRASVPVTTAPSGVRRTGSRSSLACAGRSTPPRSPTGVPANRAGNRSRDSRCCISPSGGRSAHRTRSAQCGGPDPFTRRFLLPAVVEIEVAAGESKRLAVRSTSSASRAGDAHPDARSDLAAAEARMLLAEGHAPAALAPRATATCAWSALGAPYESRAAGCRRAVRVRLARGSPRTPSSRGARALSSRSARTRGRGARRQMGDRRAGVLTPRELEVLRLVSTGLTNRGSASGSRSARRPSPATSQHLRKARTPDRSAATAYAYENGLV